MPGLPDAYFSASARQATVVVLRGRTAVTIGSYGPNADRAVLHRLATAAAARLAALPAPS